MNLVLYLLGSFAAVALLIGFAALLFGRQRARIASLADAEAGLAAEVPGFRAGRFAIAKDEDGALIENARDGALFLVAPSGQKLVTRRIDKTSLSAISRGGETLTLRFADVTFPRAVLKLDGEQAANWEALLKRAAA